MEADLDITRDNLPMQREDRLDLNHAAVEELATLPGISDRLARRIVRYRKEHGDFQAVENLTAVKGLHPAIYEGVRDRLVVAAPFAPAPAEGTTIVAGQPPSTQEPRMPASWALESQGGETNVSAPDRAQGLEQNDEQYIHNGDVLTEASTDVVLEESPSATIPLDPHATDTPADTWREPEAPPAEPATDEQPLASVGVGEAPAPAANVEALWTAEPHPAGVATAPGVSGAVHEETPQDEREELGAVPAERSRRSFVADLGLVILGALLGTALTLGVLWALNGSLLVNRSPALVALTSRVDAQANEVSAVRNDVAGLQEVVQPLTGLPARMDTVESSVGQVTSQVNELQQGAQRTQSFFQGLQSLLGDIFGGAQGSGAQ